MLNLAIADLLCWAAISVFPSSWRNFRCRLRLPAAWRARRAAAIVERIAYEPLRNTPVVTPMLSTLGFSIILQNVATNIWGSDPLQLSDEVCRRVSPRPVSISAMQLTIMGVTIVLVALLAFWCSGPRWAGPCARSPKIATLRGCLASAGRVTLFAFMLSGALSGAAGVLIGLHYGAITPYVGVESGSRRSPSW